MQVALRWLAPRWLAPRWLASGLSFVACTMVGAGAPAQDRQPSATQWHGFPRQDFSLSGVRCTVVSPHIAAAGRPWIWRARFFGHQPQTEIALLRHGFHVVYTDVAGLFGNSTALARWDLMYRHARSKLQLGPKPVLLGMSRGGLIVFRWAATNADKVACIYVDAPVCDIASWPGGKWHGKGSAADWQRCLQAHGLDEDTVGSWLGNPIDQLAPLAEEKVAILSICGAADQVVPLTENTAVVARRYRKLGGSIRIIAKAGVGHHPHSLRNAGPIVDFILRHSVGSGDYFTLRKGLSRSRARFVTGQKGCVAFLGGSITHNPGWRDQVAAELRQRFPLTQFEFINAGIPSFGSTPGAFRMHRDVFARGQRRVDLLFVEAAVNDSSNGRSGSEMTRGMEGIVRQARLQNPGIDLVMLHFVDPQKMRQLNRGVVPEVIQRHEAVARHYGVVSIDLAAEVTERIAAGEFSWASDFRNLHPSPFGQRLYARTIIRMFDAAWASPSGDTTRTLPPALDGDNYSKGRLVVIEDAEQLEGFAVAPNWQPKDRAGTRRGFVGVPMLVADRPGASLNFPFRGRGIGVLITAGPDAGQLEFSVDDAPFARIELFTRWSRRLHLPQSHVLATGLDPGRHHLRLRVGRQRHQASRGHAVRIAWFLVNRRQ